MHDRKTLGVASIISTLVKPFKRLTPGLREESKVELEEYVLEHFLLYHGLIGSSLDNVKEKQYRDVRADIRQAIKHGSSTELSIALKLPPLFWAERLETIFSELAVENMESIVKVLLPDNHAQDLLPDQIPLEHTDWKVRANAARVLAHLEIKKADEKIIASLNDLVKEDSLSPAFCHFTISLSKLQSDAGKKVLLSHLYSDEPWFRVDAANALSCWQQEGVIVDLMQAMLSPHVLSDYMAVVIARKYRPVDYLNDKRNIVVEGMLEIIIGVLEAGNKTFGAEVVSETKILNCMSELEKIVSQSFSVRAIRALRSIQKWQKQSKNNNQILGAEIIELINNKNNSSDPGQVRHAIILAGDLQLKEAINSLLQLLDLNEIFIEDVIESIGQIKEQNTDSKLIDFCQQVIDIENRCNAGLSKKPIVESKLKEANIYWLTLKALAGLPSAKTIEFLLKATCDIAPDKREQALLSLCSACDKPEWKTHYRTQIVATVANLLKDPSSSVRKEAIKAVATFDLIDCIPIVIKSIGSKEVSTYRASCNTLISLYKHGFADEVISAVKKQMTFDMNYARKRRLTEFLRELEN
jgi:HEAT repeat protein